MDIKIKVRRKSNQIGTAVSGGCEYSYNLTIKIINASKRQVDNVHQAVLKATGE